MVSYKGKAGAVSRLDLFNGERVEQVAIWIIQIVTLFDFITHRKQLC